MEKMDKTKTACSRSTAAYRLYNDVVSATYAQGREEERRKQLAEVEARVAHGVDLDASPVVERAVQPTEDEETREAVANITSLSFLQELQEEDSVDVMLEIFGQPSPMPSAVDTLTTPQPAMEVTWDEEVAEQAIDNICTTPATIPLSNAATSAREAPTRAFDTCLLKDKLHSERRMKEATLEDNRRLQEKVGFWQREVEKVKQERLDRETAWRERERERELALEEQLRHVMEEGREKEKAIEAREERIAEQVSVLSKRIGEVQAREENARLKSESFERIKEDVSRKMKEKKEKIKSRLEALLSLKKEVDEKMKMELKLKGTDEIVRMKTKAVGTEEIGRMVGLHIPLREGKLVGDPHVCSLEKEERHKTPCFGPPVENCAHLGLKFENSGDLKILGWFNRPTMDYLPIKRKCVSETDPLDSEDDFQPSKLGKF